MRLLPAFIILWALAPACAALPPGTGPPSHVIIAVIDGARYSETFGAEGKYIPVIWNELRPQGTLFTRAYNAGITKTCPGHSALLTGNWEDIPNDGSKRPKGVTLFECFRKETGEPASSCSVVSGKKKLNILTHGLDYWYGEPYQASYVQAPDTDAAVWRDVERVMDARHPRIMIINFPSVDLRGHDGAWDRYVAAIRSADSIVGLLWKKISTDPVYAGSTTLFVTDDHGRHDDAHGGFRDHGDGCGGCRHIMLLALGRDVRAGAVIADPVLQVDVAATAAELMGIEMPVITGKPLFPLPRESSR